MIRMVEVKKIKSVKPRVTEKMLKALTDSVRINGIFYPVMIDEDCKIIDGALRLEACKRLKMKTIPTIKVHYGKKISKTNTK